MLRRRSKIIAFFLLLVFSEQGGLRLWMHHWFHEYKTTGRSTTTPATETIHQACDCYQVAMMPLEAAVFFTLDIPIQKSTGLINAPEIHIPAAEKLYCSLKGPPSPRSHS